MMMMMTKMTTRMMMMMSKEGGITTTIDAFWNYLKNYNHWIGIRWILLKTKETNKKQNKKWMAI